MWSTIFFRRCLPATCRNWRNGLIRPRRNSPACGCSESAFSDAKERGHLLVFEALSGSVRLYPLAVEYELRNGPLAGVLDYLFRCVRRLFNVDVCERDIVFRQPCLGDMAVATPGCGIDSEFHSSIERPFR